MEKEHLEKEIQSLSPESFKRKVWIGFGIFVVFFIYYIGCAIIQTQNFRHIASIDVGGVPLGFILSMGVFPVSWILLTIFFKLWR